MAVTSPLGEDVIADRTGLLGLARELATDLTGSHGGQQALSAHLTLSHASAVLDVTLLVGDDVQRGHVQHRVIPCPYGKGNEEEERALRKGPGLGLPARHSILLCTLFLPWVPPQPAISHLVPGGTTYCSGGRQMRATRWFRVTGLQQE